MRRSSSSPDLLGEVTQPLEWRIAEVGQASWPGRDPPSAVEKHLRRDGHHEQPWALACWPAVQRRQGPPRAAQISSSSSPGPAGRAGSGSQQGAPGSARPGPEALGEHWMDCSAGCPSHASLALWQTERHGRPVKDREEEEEDDEEEIVELQGGKAIEQRRVESAAVQGESAPIVVNSPSRV